MMKSWLRGPAALWLAMGVGGCGVQSQRLIFVEPTYSYLRHDVALSEPRLQAAVVSQGLARGPALASPPAAVRDREFAATGQTGR